MASMAMTSSLFGSTMTLSKLPSSTPSRRVTVTMAKASEMKDVAREENSSSKRRDLVFAAAAVAACAFAKVAMADEEEPKRGTPEAKKKYGPVCVTNPTARICRY